MVYGEYGQVRMVRTEPWKYVRRYPHGPDELYDLKHDPNEKENLIGSASFQNRAKDLRKRLESWFSRYAEPVKESK